MFWTIGCVYGATSVALGAFGAHGLKKRIADPARLTNWSTAAQYQVRPHSLGTTSRLTGAMAAHPLGCPPPHHDHGSAEPSRRIPLHSRHDNVQWEHISFGFRSPALWQNCGTYHSAWWIVSDWGLGRAGIWKKGTLQEILIEDGCNFCLFQKHLFAARITSSFQNVLLLGSLAICFVPPVGD